MRSYMNYRIGYEMNDSELFLVSGVAFHFADIYMRYDGTTKVCRKPHDRGKNANQTTCWKVNKSTKRI